MTVPTTGYEVPEPAPTDGTSTRAERTGWYFYNFADHAFQTTVLAVVVGPYLTGVAEAAADPSGHVHPLGITIRAGAYYPYLLSLSVLLSVFALPVMGTVADRSPRKRWLLAGAAYVGAAACAAMFFVTGAHYLLGGLLYLIAGIALNAASVVYNSFLPQLVGPEKRDATSSLGWSLGYVGGGLHLALALVAFTVFGATGTTSRWVMLSAGLWWAAFALLPLTLLNDRPPVVDPGATGHSLLAGFRQLAHTVRSLKAYPLTLFFLLAFLVYNDGIQTVIALAGVYGTQELGLKQGTLAATILVVQFVAFGGALGLGWLARFIGAWKTILVSLVLWTLVVGAAFGLPAGRPVPFMILGACIGVVLGGSQALSRSLFSQLIPRGKEAEYFGFYGISDKGTSWLGPLVFGLVYDITNSYRVGIVSLLVFFVIGFFMLLAVPVRRAIVAVGNVPPRVL